MNTEDISMADSFMKDGHTILQISRDDFEGKYTENQIIEGLNTLYESERDWRLINISAGGAPPDNFTF